MPVQLICGEKTLDVVQLVMAGLHKRLPSSRIMKVEKAGHMLPMTHPKAVAEALRNLWGD